MPYYTVVFHKDDPVEIKEHIGYAEGNITFKASEHRPMSNEIISIAVTLKSSNRETAISDAVFTMLSNMEDSLANETRRRFYTALVGREPVYPYIRLGEVEHVMQ